MPAPGGRLPVVKFTVVEPPATAPPDVANPQLAGYGYNDGREWSAYHDAVSNGDGGRYLRWLRESSRSPRAPLEDAFRVASGLCTARTLRAAVQSRPGAYS